MPSPRAAAHQPDDPPRLTSLATFPGLRALAWAGDTLYASRGYDLLRIKVSPESSIAPDNVWQTVASFRPASWRRATCTLRLSSRLFRDGFHALSVCHSGALIAAVPGAILTCRPGESQFHASHSITRGTRPLHITAIPGGAIFWGEYFDNAARDEVHIYTSQDDGATWDVAYTFPRGAIRHVHNIVHDAFENCLWVLTGDCGKECRILRAACDLSRVDVIVEGDQQARAVALLPTKDGLYFSSDSPLEPNHIYFLDHQARLSQITSITSSSIYGCCVGDEMFFSTMVEPSQANPDRHVRIYGSRGGGDWHPLLAWKKDRWPMGLFQYGNAFLPDGINLTKCLAVTTIAVESADLLTSLYAVAA